MNARYAELQARCKARGHRNKCVVIDMALLTDESYDDVYEVLSRFIPGVGVRGGYYPSDYMPILRRMLKARGKELVTLDLHHVRRVAKTTKTLDGRGASRLGIRFGLVHSRGHIAAVMNFRVADWSEDRVKRITKLYDVREAIT